MYIDSNPIWNWVPPNSLDHVYDSYPLSDIEDYHVDLVSASWLSFDESDSPALSMQESLIQLTKQEKIALYQLPELVSSLTFLSENVSLISPTHHEVLKKILFAIFEKLPGVDTPTAQVNTALDTLFKKLVSPSDALNVPNFSVQAAIATLPFKVHKLSFDQIAQIATFVEEKFSVPIESPPLCYLTKQDTGLARPIVLDPKKRSFFILSKKFGDLGAQGGFKWVQDAVQVCLLQNPQTGLSDVADAKHYVQIRGPVDDQELEWLIKYSGLDTQVVSHTCKKYGYVHRDILQEAGVTLFQTEELELSWSDRKDIILQIATALSRLHADGIMHRDLKNINVIVKDAEKKSRKVAIIDYGLSYDSHEVANSLENKPLDYGFDCLNRYNSAYKVFSYSAPEILLEAGRLANSTSQAKAEDMFAFGCLIYEYLYGETIPWDFEEYDDVESALVSYNTCFKELQEEYSGIEDPTEKMIHEIMLLLLVSNPAERLTAEQVRDQILLFPAKRPVDPTFHKEALEQPAGSFDLKKLLFSDTFLTEISHKIARTVVASITPKPACARLVDTGVVVKELQSTLIKEIEKLTLEKGSVSELQFDDLTDRNTNILARAIKGLGRNPDDFTLPTTLRMNIWRDSDDLKLKVYITRPHISPLATYTNYHIPPKCAVVQDPAPLL